MSVDGTKRTLQPDTPDVRFRGKERTSTKQAAKSPFDP